MMKLVSLTSLLVSALMGLSSVNILSIWIFMELNVISFVLYISLSRSNLFAPQMAQYFIVQSVGSLLLVVLLVLSETSGTLSSTTNLALVPLILKMGMPPLHAWYVSFISESNWAVLFIASSAQKLMPLYLIAQYWNFGAWIITAMVLITIFGAFQQNWMKSFLAYSSIFSGCWLLASVKMFHVSVLYLFIYCLSLMVFCAASQNNQVSSMKTLIKTNSQVLLLLMQAFAMLSMAGVPPLLGFLGKLLLLTSLMKFDFLISLLLLSSSMVMLAVYLSISITQFNQMKLTPFNKTQIYTHEGAVFVLVLFFPAFLFLLHLSVQHKKFWFF